MDQDTTFGVDAAYQIPGALWALLEELLPPRPSKKKAGRPRMPDRQAMTAIFYGLRTSCQWKALPRSLGASSTVHDRFTEWRAAGVFERLWLTALMFYDDQQGIDWTWQAVDGAMTKAPLGGKRYGTEPHRPGQERDQTQPPDRWPRDPLGGCRRRRQPPRQQAAGADPGQPGAGAARADRGGAAAHAAGQRL